MADTQADRIRRYEEWFPKSGQLITQQALGEIQKNHAMREELSRRLRQQGFKDASNQNAVGTLVTALKANNLAFQSQGDQSLSSKAAYYRKQGELMITAAVVANHSRKGSVAQFTEGWSKVEAGVAPLGSTGNRITDKVVEMVRKRAGDMGDQEALSWAINDAKSWLTNPSEFVVNKQKNILSSIKSQHDKLDQTLGLDGLTSVASLKGYLSAHSGYMMELEKKNAVERLHNVLVGTYANIANDETSFKKTDVGRLENVQPLKYTGSLVQAYRDMGRGKPGGVADPYEFAGLMLKGGVPEQKLATFIGQRIDKNMVPGIMADSKAMVAQFDAEQAKRQKLNAEKWALCVVGNDKKPIELKNRVQERAPAEIAPKPVSAPKMASNTNTAPKPKPVAQQVPKAPEQDNRSFFERLKDQARQNVEDLMIRAGLKKEAPKPEQRPYGEAIKAALPKLPKRDTFLGPDAIPDARDFALFAKIDSIMGRTAQMKVGGKSIPQQGIKQEGPEEHKLDIDGPKLAMGMGRMR